MNAGKRHHRKLRARTCLPWLISWAANISNQQPEFWSGHYLIECLADSPLRPRVGSGQVGARNRSGVPTHRRRGRMVYDL